MMPLYFNDLTVKCAALAGERLRPLGHVSADGYSRPSLADTRRNCLLRETSAGSRQRIELETKNGGQPWRIQRACNPVESARAPISCEQASQAGGPHPIIAAARAV
jgi:hypothetical protein